MSTLNNQSVFCIEGHVVDRETAQNGTGVKENISQTLNATDRHAIFAAGFDGSMGAKAGNIGYEEEKAPPLNAGKVMNMLCLNDQGGAVVVGDGISPTLTARMGTGGNQVNAILIVKEEQ